MGTGEWLFMAYTQEFNIPAVEPKGRWLRLSGPERDKWAALEARCVSEEFLCYA
jgi:hypothetical protein